MHDYRQAAEQAEKLADTFLEIRALTVFRWKLTATAIWSGAAAVITVDLVYGAAALWITAGAGTVALAITGRHKDGSPGRKAVLAGPRTLTWTMDPHVLVDAFRDAKLIGKDESLRLANPAWSDAQKVVGAAHSPGGHVADGTSHGLVVDDHYPGGHPPRRAPVNRVPPGDLRHKIVPLPVLPA